MSLINQMLKDIDKRQGASPSMPPAHHDLQGVMKPSFPLRTVLLGTGLVAALVVAGFVVINGKRVSAPAPMPVVVAPVSAPAPLASMPAPVKTTEPVKPVVVAEVATASPPVKVNSLPTPPKAMPAEVVLAAPAKSTVDISATSPKAAPSGSVSRVLTAEQRAENLYRDAVELIKQGRMAEAQGLLKRALSEYALHHASRQLLARSLVESGQSEEAKTLLLDGLTIAPQRTELYIALAHVHLSNNDLDAAIKAMESGLPVASNNAEFHAFLAALLQRKGRHEEAIEHYVIALRKVPDAANWLLGLGISLQAQKDVSSATEAYQRAIELGLTPSLMQFAQERLRQLAK